MPNPFDAPFATQRAQCKASEIAAEHQTGYGRPEVLDRDTQGDEGAEEAVGELDDTRRQDQDPDLRS